MEFIFFPIHMLALAYSAWNIFNADRMGFSWIKGKVNTLDAKEVAKYHKATWIGLLLLIGSGVGLFWPKRDYLLNNPAFYIKMGFIAALFINSFFIDSLQKVATSKSCPSLNSKEKFPLYLSGAVSTISWIGAGITAFFLLP